MHIEKQDWQRHNNMTMATKFTSADGKIFTVEEVKQVDKELWVYYTNIETNNKYSCLLEAFSQRFTPQEQ
jgi:hypothetical protein